MTHSNHKVIAWLILGLLALIWGSSFIIMKRGLEVFSPLQIGAIRVSLAYLTLLPFAFKHLFLVSRRKYFVLFLSGSVGILIPAFLFPLAQTQLESSVTGILNSLTPLFTLLLGILFFRFQSNFLQALGILLGLIGALLLTMNNILEGISFNFHAIWVLLATFCYAINVNLIKTYLHGIKALHIGTLALFFVGPIGLFFIFYLEIPKTYMSTSGSTLILAYLAILAIFGTAIASIFYNRLVQISSPIFASSVTYLIPIVALIWGWLDDEKLLWIHYFGTGIILTGIYLVNLKVSKKQ